MYGLIQAYIERFKFLGMVMAAIVPPALVSVPIGHYFGKLLDIDDQLFIGGVFFALLAAEVYAYDRFQRWYYFRKLRP